jgi:hypothetical protein
MDVAMAEPLAVEPRSEADRALAMLALRPPTSSGSLRCLMFQRERD